MTIVGRTSVNQRVYLRQDTTHSSLRVDDLQTTLTLKFELHLAGYLTQNAPHTKARSCDKFSVLNIINFTQAAVA